MSSVYMVPHLTVTIMTIGLRYLITFAFAANSIGLFVYLCIHYNFYCILNPTPCGSYDAYSEMSCKFNVYCSKKETYSIALIFHSFGLLKRRYLICTRQKSKIRFTNGFNKPLVLCNHSYTCRFEHDI
ncbi:hypothetical protein KP509_19G009500 [Ceratopteris richardii]|uniref:Uncharacterized protein n=1 Tax=Ceratopteris richardii TaxID=49495 RepID=A0A8T2SHY8_CERRI|nr:hypothetical protein KP509_19G009500 [Ceratopteris richardii]